MQQSRFIALVSNWERLDEVSKAAMDSQDAGLLQYAKTLDSLESKINNIKTSFQEFYMQIAQGPVIGGMLEIITKFIETLTSGGLLASATQILNLIQLIKLFGNVLVSSFNDSLQRMQSDWNYWAEGIGKRLRKEVEENVRQGLKNGTSSDINIQGQNSIKNSKTLSTLGSFLPGIGSLVGTGITMTSGNSALGGAVGNTVSGIGNAVRIIASGGSDIFAWFGLVTNAIGTISSAFKIQEENLKKLKKEAEDANIKRAESKQELKDLVEVRKKLEQLTKARNDNAEAYQEWIDYNNEVAEKYPELISYIDSEGNSIIELSYAYDALTEAKKRAAGEASSNYYLATRKSIKEQRKQVDDELTTIVGKDSGIDLNNFNYEDQQTFNFIKKYFTDISRDFNTNFDTILEKYRNKTTGKLFGDGISFLDYIGIDEAGSFEDFGEQIKKYDFNNKEVARYQATLLTDAEAYGSTQEAFERQTIQILETNLGDQQKIVEELKYLYQAYVANALGTNPYKQKSLELQQKAYDAQEKQEAEKAARSQLESALVGSRFTSEQQKLIVNSLIPYLSKQFQELTIEELEAGKDVVATNIAINQYSEEISKLSENTKDFFNNWTENIRTANKTTIEGQINNFSSQELKDVYLEDYYEYASEAIARYYDSLGINFDNFDVWKSNQDLKDQTFGNYIEYLQEFARDNDEIVLNITEDSLNTLDKYNQTLRDTNELIAGSNNTKQIEARQAAQNFIDNIFKTNGKDLSQEFIDALFTDIGTYNWAKAVKESAKKYNVNIDTKAIDAGVYELYSTVVNSLEDTVTSAVKSMDDYLSMQKDGWEIGKAESFAKSLNKNVGEIFTNVGGKIILRSTDSIIEWYNTQLTDIQNRLAIARKNEGNLNKEEIAALEQKEQLVLNQMNQAMINLYEEVIDSIENLTSILSGGISGSMSLENVIGLGTHMLTQGGWSQDNWTNFQSKYISQLPSGEFKIEFEGAAKLATELDLVGAVWEDLVDSFESIEDVENMWKDLGNSIDGAANVILKNIEAIKRADAGDAMFDFMGQGMDSYADTYKTMAENLDDWSGVMKEAMETGTMSIADFWNISRVMSKSLKGDQLDAWNEYAKAVMASAKTTEGGIVAIEGTVEGFGTGLDAMKIGMQDYYQSLAKEQIKIIDAQIAALKAQEAAEKAIKEGQTVSIDNLIYTGGDDIGLFSQEDVNLAKDLMKKDRFIKPPKDNKAIQARTVDGIVEERKALQQKRYASDEDFAKLYQEVLTEALNKGLDTTSVEVQQMIHDSTLARAGLDNYSDSLKEIYNIGQILSDIKNDTSAIATIVNSDNTQGAAGGGNNADTNGENGPASDEANANENVNQLNSKINELSAQLATLKEEENANLISERDTAKTELATAEIDSLTSQLATTNGRLDTANSEYLSPTTTTAEPKAPEYKKFNDELLDKLQGYSGKEGSDAENFVIESIEKFSQVSARNGASQEETLSSIENALNTYLANNPEEEGINQAVYKAIQELSFSDYNDETGWEDLFSSLQLLKNDWGAEGSNAAEEFKNSFTETATGNPPTTPIKADTEAAKISVEDMIKYLGSKNIVITVTLQGKYQGHGGFPLSEEDIKFLYNANGGPSNYAGNVSGLALYNGTNLANKTLVGELGPELAVYDDMYHLLGQNGAEFVDIPDDAIVFNHRQTEGIIRGQTGYRGKAFVNGNVSGPAYASGTAAAIQKLEEAKAMWQAIADMDIGSLLSAADSGGGGGGSNTIKAHIEDLEEWYNLLRQIENLEQKITNIQAERANITDGHKYLRSLREEQSLLEKQVTTQEVLLDYQQKQLKLQADQINNNKIWSQFLTVGSDGLLQYKKGNEANGGKGALEVLQDLNEMSGEEQQAFLKKLGYSYTTTDGDKLEGEELIAKFYEELQAQIDAYDELYDTVNETEGELENLETSIRSIDEEIRQNQMDLETAVYETLVEMREKEISQLEEQVDLIKEANDAYIDGIQKAIQAERDLYEKNEAISEREQLQRRLSLLRMSGGSASEIADLEAQLDETLKNEYFSRQEESLNAIQEASEKQIERLDNQIRIMEENLAYQKENGLLWQKVYDIMAGGENSLLDFLKGNNSKFFEASALEQQDMLVQWAKMVGIYKEDEAYKYYEETGKSIWDKNYSTNNSLSGLSESQRSSVSDEFSAAYAKYMLEGMSSEEATKAAWDDVQRTISNMNSQNYESENNNNGTSGSNTKVESKSFTVKISAANVGGSPQIKMGSSAAHTSMSARAGNVITILHNPKEGYKAAYSTVNGTTIGLSTTITVTGNTVIKVYYTTRFNSRNNNRNASGIDGTYAKGGIVPEDQVAQVHKGEGILDSKQAPAFMEMVESFRKLSSFNNPLLSFIQSHKDSLSSKISNNSNGGDTITIAPGAVQIAVAELNDKYDVEELANDVMNRMVVIANKATNRGVNRR